MNAHQLKQATQIQLRDARSRMLSTEHFLAVSKLSKKLQQEDAILLSEVHVAYLKMRTCKLKDIRTQLVKETANLQKGISDMQAAVKKVTKVGSFLKSLSSFLKVVGRIVP